jgi:hypothetical protein
MSKSIVFSDKVMGSYDIFKKLSGLNSLPEISHLVTKPRKLTLQAAALGDIAKVT